MTRLEVLPEVLTVAEVQGILRIGRNQAYGLIESGDLPSFRVGRSIRVSKEAVQALLSGDKGSVGQLHEGGAEGE